MNSKLVEDSPRSKQESQASVVFLFSNTASTLDGLQKRPRGPSLRSVFDGQLYVGFSTSTTRAAWPLTLSHSTHMNSSGSSQAPPFR